MQRPRFIVSRRRAALFVVLGYISIIAFAALLFATLEQDLRRRDGGPVRGGALHALAADQATTASVV